MHAGDDLWISPYDHEFGGLSFLLDLVGCSTRAANGQKVAADSNV